RFRRRGRTRSRPHPCAERRRPGHSRRIRERRHIRGDPHRALPARDGARPSRACVALRRTRADDAHDEARAGPRGREPEEHSARARGPGVPRRRMRLVRRPVLRSRLLPQPSPAQGRARGRESWALLRRLFGACRSLSRSCRVGERGRSRKASRRVAPRAIPRQDRRQVAGRVPHTGERARGGAPDSRAAHLESAAAAHGRRKRMGARPMSEPVIQSLIARRIWDSRGRPTVDAEVALSDGAVGRGIAPAGASRGSREAIGKRDGGKRFGGFDVLDALQGIRTEIAPALVGLDPFDQSGIDARLIALDGTPNKARLGGNALTAVSLAVLHAAAASRGLPLWRHCLGDEPAIIPLPEIQIFGGGAHAGRRTDIQDFMVIAPRAKSFAEALEVTAEIYQAAGAIMAERGLLQGVADEGGWWPAFSSNEAALDTLMRAIERAGFAPGEDAAVSLDVAASEFGKEGRYRLGLDRRELDRDALAEMLLSWRARYPILSIEDPFAEDDDEGFERFTAAVGDRIQVIGDDYLVTSASRVREAARRRSVNAALIKVNQAGTVSEARAACEEARRAGFGTIVSARSGETEDTSIVHLAIGWGAGQLKVGSFARSERMAKWNEALRIEEALGSKARFASLDELPMRRRAVRPAEPASGG